VALLTDDVANLESDVIKMSAIGLSVEVMSVVVGRGKVKMQF